MDSFATSLSLLLFLAIFLLALFASGNAILILAGSSSEDLSIDLRLSLAIMLGMSLIPLLFLWSSTLSLRLSSAFAFSYLFVAILINVSPFLFGATPVIPRLSTRNLWQNSSFKAVVWLSGVFFLTWCTRFVAVRGFLVAPGIDSYHHTLIADLIVKQGQIPTSYEPYAPPSSFTYHFGFHTLTTFMYWLTDIPLPKLVLWVGQALNALVVLSMYFFTKRLTNHYGTALIASFLVGLVAVFPAYMANWSRFTQLSGLVVLTLTIGIVVGQCNRLYWRITPLLVGGIFLYHYRVFAMLAFLVGVTGIIFLVTELRSVPVSGFKSINLQRLLFLVWLILGGLVLVTPWLVESVVPRLSEYNARLSTATQGGNLRAYYDLNRLGSAWNFYSNYWLLFLAGFGLIKGFFTYRVITLAIVSWVVMLLLWSNPYWLSLPGAGVLDINSVVMSLFGPICFFAALGIVYFVFEAIQGWNMRWSWGLQWGWKFVLAGFVIFAIFRMINIVDPNDIYVQNNDMQAMNWIKANTEPEAMFLVNPLIFGWRADPGGSVLGSDAGYWIPLLANRRTTTLPMVIVNEEISRSELEKRAELSKIAIRPSVSSLAKLKEARVTHIFVGEKGGPIPLDVLESTSCATKIWHKDQTNVFALNYACIGQ